MAEGYKPGDIVWAKMDGYPWWPARIASDEIRKELTKSKKFDGAAVLFFGSELTYGLVLYKDIAHFEKCFKKYSTASVSKDLQKEFKLAIDMANNGSNMEDPPLEISCEEEPEAKEVETENAMPKKRKAKEESKVSNKKPKKQEGQNPKLEENKKVTNNEVKNNNDEEEDSNTDDNNLEKPKQNDKIESEKIGESNIQSTCEGESKEDLRTKIAPEAVNSKAALETNKEQSKQIDSKTNSKDIAESINSEVLLETNNEQSKQIDSKMNSKDIEKTSVEAADQSHSLNNENFKAENETDKKQGSDSQLDISKDKPADMKDLSPSKENTPSGTGIKNASDAEQDKKVDEESIPESAENKN